MNEIDNLNVSTGFVTVSFIDRDERLFKQLCELKTSHNPALRDRPQWILLKGELAEWVRDEFREVEEETMVHEILKVDYNRDRDLWTDGAVVCIDVKEGLYYTVVSDREKVRTQLDPLRI